jgi:hypothetical protein
MKPPSIPSNSRSITDPTGKRYMVLFVADLETTESPQIIENLVERVGELENLLRFVADYDPFSTTCPSWHEIQRQIKSFIHADDYRRN